jgi:chemotaxis protein MotC
VNMLRAVISMLLVMTIPASLFAEETPGHEADRHGSSTVTEEETRSEDSGETTYAGPLASVRDIRSLFALQDAVANGHRSAIALQKSMIVQIEKRLLEDVVSSEADRLAPSVAGYVLSGGNPAVAERLLESEVIGGRNRHLLKGASLYMQGKSEEASAELKFVEVDSLPPPVAGRVALARAVLAADGDERQRFLMTAIALMPGSLVEESALRRSALSHAESGDQQRFWSRVSRYLRRFARSLYAYDFMTAVVKQAVAFEQVAIKVDLRQLDLLLNACDTASRRALYKELARSAAAANLPELTAFGARRLRRISVPGSAEAQTAELYDFIFEAASKDSDRAAERLQNIKAELLSTRERGLLDAALKISRQIDAPAEIRPLHAWDGTGGETSEIEQRTRAALEKVQTLLERPE